MNHILLYYLISLPIALIILLIIDKWKHFFDHDDDVFIAVLTIFWPITLFIGIIISIVSIFRFIIDLFFDLT